MTIPPTGNATIDALSTSAARLSGVVSSVEAQRDWFMFAALLVSEPSTGFTLLRVPAVAEGDVLLANDALLSMLHYADLATYRVARVSPGFIHAADQASFDEQVAGGHSATFSARYKRGDNGNYTRLVSQGLTFSLHGQTYRVAVVREG